MAQAAEERTARRRSSESRPAQPRKPRRAKPAAEPALNRFAFLDALPDDDDIAPPVRQPKLAAAPGPARKGDADRPTRTPRAGRQSLKAIAKRAERSGSELPRLPSGQRWKRRLPPSCW
jgi:hypothetical protein